ncbi:MAG: radical SAM protein [Chitinivibrionales bacterium]|nr:radical SAM protein [Chitinivibrionales bacterium]MBD3394206.1 radical SAM protein [Chitinivibrionales bacterium]
MARDNFAWICTWKITHRCNLSCTYCDHTVMRPAGANERVDYRRIAAGLERFAPKIVNISGGEPTLVAGLPDIVRDLKSRFNPFIRIVHNGTQPHKAVPAFPYIDRLVVSVDGPGDVNRATRGIDGNRVVDKLGAIVDDAAMNGVELAVNTVVTKNNLGSLGELADRIHRVAPSIVLSLTPVMPPDGPLSILLRDDLLEEFECTYQGLRERGVHVMHTFDSVRRHTTFSCIECFNQFFTIRVSPEGRISACPMNVPLKAAVAHVPVRKLVSIRGLKHALAETVKAAKARFGRDIDFSCSTICNCESWLDMLFLGMESNAAPVYLRGLHGRLGDRDYAGLEEFVKTNINPDFDIAAFRKRVDAAV